MVRESNVETNRPQEVHQLEALLKSLTISTGSLGLLYPSNGLAPKARTLPQKAPSSPRSLRAYGISEVVQHSILSCVGLMWQFRTAFEQRLGSVSFLLWQWVTYTISIDPGA